MSWLIPEWLLALALTLFVVDIFVDEEGGVLSWCGVAAVAGWATWRIGAPVKWSVLIFIGAFLVSGAAWHWLFRAFVSQPIRRLMQRDAPDEAIVAIKGAKGGPPRHRRQGYVPLERRRALARCQPARRRGRRTVGRGRRHEKRRSGVETGKMTRKGLACCCGFW